MNASVFETGKIKIFAILFSLVFVGSIFYMLNTFFKSLSNEVIETWYGNERTNLQQGLILSSVTKLQRVITGNSFLRGVRVIDENHRDLMQIGNNFSIPSEVPALQAGSTSVYEVGLFQRGYQIKEGPVTVLFFFSAWTLRYVLAGVLVYFMVILFIGAGVYRKFLLNQEELKASVEREILQKRLEVSEMMAFLGRQVAHDIRAPLMAIETAIRCDSDSINASKELLINASRRVKEISEELLSQTRNFSKQQNAIPNSEFLAHRTARTTEIDLQHTVESLLNEKRILHSHIHFEFDGPHSETRMQVDPIAFQRMLSNLLQNSIEALTDSPEPKVRICSRRYRAFWQISIFDNGKGIPDHIIDKVGTSGFTFQKINGNGLGVSYVRQMVAEWNGKFSISSQPERGTIVTFTIPQRSCSLDKVEGLY